MRNAAPPPARPLTARSVIASTLLGTTPPRATAARLVLSCVLFGFQENAARVALSRMVAAGELSASDGSYELVGRLRERQVRQLRSRQGTTPLVAWDQTWRLAVVIGTARPPTERAELRRRLGLARFAEWREGVWLRPDVNVESLSDAEDCVFVPGARPPDAVPLARTLFALDAWSDSARSLIAEMEPLHRRLTRRDAASLTDAFILNAAVLRHLQADPFLPPELLPSRWPGARLRARYEAFDAAFVSLWQATLRET
jgi:phenylacetic acid degradation operon negative regulatory protein